MARSTVKFLRRIVEDVRATGPVGAAIRALEDLSDGDATALRNRLCSIHPTAADRAIRSKFLADVLSDCATIIEYKDKLQKAALERVEWIPAGPNRHVAKVGKDVFHLRGSTTGLVLKIAVGDDFADLGLVPSTEAGARRVRAYRAGKWPKKGGR